jgi:hypothetical protein
MRTSDRQNEAAIRLWNITKGDSGQCRYVVRFLLGIYNGSRFPFDLTSFRALDTPIVLDCLDVLTADARPEKEIHNWLAQLLPDEKIDFEEMAVRWGVKRSG